MTCLFIYAQLNAFSLQAFIQVTHDILHTTFLALLFTSRFGTFSYYVGSFYKHREDAAVSLIKRAESHSAFCSPFFICDKKIASQRFSNISSQLFNVPRSHLRLSRPTMWVIRKQKLPSVATENETNSQRHRSPGPRWSGLAYKNSSITLSLPRVEPSQRHSRALLSSLPRYARCYGPTPSAIPKLMT